MGTAAKTALKRKKQHEHSLEQTQAQIGTLEQQINAIESANINKETLLAMEKASEAMKQIHGKLTPEKVDETMYAVPSPPLTAYRASTCLACSAKHDRNSGTSYGSKMRSAKRSSTPSRATKSESPSTTWIWRRSWTNYSRRRWTSRCSRLGRCRCRTRSNGSLPHPKTVSPTPRATSCPHILTSWNSQGQDAGRGTGGRRRGRAAEAASRNGHVRSFEWHREHVQCQQDTRKACLQTIGRVTEVDEEVVQSRWARTTAAGIPPATGVGVQEAAFVIAREIGGQWRQPAIQFPNHIERPTVLLIRCLTDWLEDYMWRIA